MELVTCCFTHLWITKLLGQSSKQCSSCLGPCLDMVWIDVVNFVLLWLLLCIIAYIRLIVIYHVANYLQFSSVLAVPSACASQCNGSTSTMHTHTRTQFRSQQNNRLPIPYNYAHVLAVTGDGCIMTHAINPNASKAYEIKGGYFPLKRVWLCIAHWTLSVACNHYP